MKPGDDDEIWIVKKGRMAKHIYTQYLCALKTFYRSSIPSWVNTSLSNILLQWMLR